MDDGGGFKLSPEEMEQMEKELYLLESNGMSARKARRVQSGRIGLRKRKSAARVKVKRHG